MLGFGWRGLCFFLCNFFKLSYGQGKPPLRNLRSPSPVHHLAVGQLSVLASIKNSNINCCCLPSSEDSNWKCVKSCLFHFPVFLIFQPINTIKKFHIKEICKLSEGLNLHPWWSNILSTGDSFISSKILQYYYQIYYCY